MFFQDRIGRVVSLSFFINFQVGGIIVLPTLFYANKRHEIYRKFDTSSGTSSLILERTTVHISDDAGRIAMLEKRIIGTDDAEEVLTRYVYSNHLQSASLELDEEADIISYEEYHPYGTTAFQAKNASINAVAKRYRYTDKERDEESGLYYHGARYYIPWLCRWTAIDPMESKYASMSPYNYSFNNPIMWNDPSGADPDENIGLSPNNPAQAEGATVVGEHPIHGKIRKIEGEIKGHFINAAKNLASTRTSFGPISTFISILAPRRGTNSLSEYWGGVKERASEYFNSIKGLPALGDQILKASGVSISPAMPLPESNIDHIAQLKNAYAQLEILNGFASEIEQLTADLRAASHGNNRAKGKLGLDAFVSAVTDGLGRYVEGVKTLKSGKPGGVKSPYPEGYKTSRYSASQGSEYMDDAIRTVDQPLTSKATTPELRAAYENEVQGLSKLAEEMRSTGSSAEDIARKLHGMRRELGVKYKSLTPDHLLQEIYQRNISKYGDKLGPSIEWLRNNNKSWED